MSGHSPPSVVIPTSRWRLLVATVWLGISAVMLLAHGLGLDALAPPALRYALTWDMYPHFATESLRRVALGQTRSGRVLVLHPSASQQFRQGVHGDLTRVELDRGGAWFQTVVEQTRRATAPQHRADPIVRVWLCEQRWPVRFNLSDRDYERWWGGAKPADATLFPGQGGRSLASAPPGIARSAWRVIREYAVVESDGDLP